MRRLARYTFNALTVLSLLLCAATVALWVWSYAREARLSHLLHGRRCSLVSHRGLISVCVPPGASQSWQRRWAERAVASIRNDRACWIARFEMRGSTDAPPYEVQYPDIVQLHPDSLPTPDLYRAEEVDALLLTALEDPNRFVAAHVLLRQHHDPDFYGTRLPFRAIPGEFLTGRPYYVKNGHRPRIQVEDDGLIVTLDSWLDAGTTRPARGPEREDASWSFQIATRAANEEPLLGIADAAQIPRIRDQWHRRLDVRVAAISHRRLAATWLVLPALWMALKAHATRRRRRFHRQKICPECRYDLRATPDRCPECGAVPAAAASAPRA